MKKIKQIDMAGKNVLSAILFQKTILFFVTLSPITSDWSYVKVPISNWVYQQILAQNEFSKNHYVFISRKTRSIYVTIIIFNSSLQLFFQILPTKNHHRSSATVPRELICIKGATLAAMPIEAEQLESLGHLRRRVEV